MKVFKKPESSWRIHKIKLLFLSYIVNAEIMGLNSILLNTFANKNMDVCIRIHSRSCTSMDVTVEHMDIRRYLQDQMSIQFNTV